MCVALGAGKQAKWCSDHDLSGTRLERGDEHAKHAFLPFCLVDT